MSAASQEQVVEFDNLVRPSDVVGRPTPVRAVLMPAESFANSNAAGVMRQINTLEELKECAQNSGRRLREMLQQAK